MITIDDLFILSDDEVEEEKNSMLVQEVDKQNKFIMDLNVKLNTNTFYKIFCKKNKSGKDEDNCKLTFLRFLNFPDGIYLEINEDNIKCHVFELKKNPMNKLKKISMQFLTAKFHIISLFAILEIDLKKVEFYYYVGYVKDIGLVEKINQGSTRKVIPGHPTNHPKEVRDWINSRIEVSLGSQFFQEEISKIKMDFYEVNNINFDVYKKDFTIA